MWTTKILPVRRKSSSPVTDRSSEASLTLAEAGTLRQQAIHAMCQALADHDFTSARQYSDEEARLKHLIAEMGAAKHVEQGRTA